MHSHTGAEVETSDASVGITARAPRARLSPLARGIYFRLIWAAGLSALLWLAVFWALA
jgi:hypothetical protein